MTNTLISKIAKASLKVGALKTDKRNAQQGYDYISADKILERAGDALCEAGVVIVPSITQEITEAVKTDKGGTRYDSVVHFLMTLTDGESQLEMSWCGRGNDYSVPDKALYKAITSGHKYFLMKLLNIGVGNEDGEHESDGEAAQAATKSPTKATPAEQPKKGIKPPASTEQLAEIDRLGQLAYADEWDANKNKLAEWVSKGTIKVLDDLLSQEAATLIASLKKKLAA